MSTLLERLETLADEVGGQRALSRLAGLAEGHLGVTISRMRQKESASVDVVTAWKIAQATGVSMRWLVTGMGDKHGAVRVLADLPDWPELRALALEQPRATETDIDFAGRALTAVIPYRPETLAGLAHVIGAERELAARAVRVTGTRPAEPAPEGNATPIGKPRALPTGDQRDASAKRRRSRDA